MRTSDDFRKFIDLEDFVPNSKKFEAKKIATMTDFKQGVRDFIYLPQYDSMFICMSDMNIVTRLDSYFTNVSAKFLLIL